MGNSWQALDTQSLSPLACSVLGCPFIMSLASIRSLVQDDLDAADQFIYQELNSDIPLINQLVEYIVKSGGKRIRPLVAILTAKALDPCPQKHIDLAVAIELIHTATLLHDDVVDNSTLRRGNQTANAIWGNEASVLVGDFLYTRAFQIAVRLKNLDILNLFVNATNLIAEGEILQLLNAHNPNTTEEAYYEVIKRKTARLFELATQCSTALSSYTDDQMKAMQVFGMQFGIAYQLIDDALDYHASSIQTGKNIGNDLAEGKPTLPLIHAIRHGSSSEATLIQNALKKGSTENFAEIMEVIESTGGIDYTAKAAKQHAIEGQALLKQIPDSPYRKALHDLTEFVVERTF